MFELYLDNGLPAKPFKFVDHFDDYEETKEYKDGLYISNDSEKIVVVSFHEVDKKDGHLEGVYFIGNQLWIELKNAYLVCDGLSEKTKKFLVENNTIKLGFFYHETNSINITEKIILNSIKID